PWAAGAARPATPGRRGRFPPAAPRRAGSGRTAGAGGPRWPPPRRTRSSRRALRPRAACAARGAGDGRPRPAGSRFSTWTWNRPHRIPGVAGRQARGAARAARLACFGGGESWLRIFRKPHIMDVPLEHKEKRALQRRLVELALAVRERERAERRLSAQYATARALAESGTLAEAAPRI